MKLKYSLDYKFVLVEWMCKKTHATHLIFRKMKGILTGQCLRTFRESPNFEDCLTPWVVKMPENIVTHRISVDVPRPARFLFVNSLDPDQAEISFLRNDSTRRNLQDLRLFIEIAGAENVPNFFNFSREDIIWWHVFEEQYDPNDAFWDNSRHFM